jgi:hypothetical protein
MIRFVVLGCFLLSACFVFPFTLLATTYNVDIYALVPGCGDALIQTGESCDGTNLGGATCESVGFDEGSLSCSSVCTLITTSCVLDDSPTTGGTRSGGTDGVVVTDTNVIVSGQALPGMSVTLLKDGQRVATVPAKDDGTYQITLTGLATGVYKMQVVGTLGYTQSVKSDVFVVRVIKNSTTKISGVVLPPTLNVEEDATHLIISGRTFPGIPVQLIIDGVKTALVNSDETGRYQFMQPKRTSLNDTSVVVDATYNGIIISASQVLESVGISEAPLSACQLRADTNSDCHVDVVDFFVMRWRFLAGVVTDRFDFNRDGLVTITDFSIMAYYWTG